MHFVVACSEEDYFSSAKIITNIKGYDTTSIFDLKVCVCGGGGNIITCTKNPLNYVASKTVPIDIVPCMFSQAPVFFARRIRRWSVELRSLTKTLSLESLTTSRFFCPSKFYSLSSTR